MTLLYLSPIKETKMADLESSVASFNEILKSEAILGVKSWGHYGFSLCSESF